MTAQSTKAASVFASELGESEKVCYSGDLVRWTRTDFLYFVGRRDNMIKSSGFRISPNEVEEVLFQSGMLREAAVIGIPDETLGTSLKPMWLPETENREFGSAALVLCRKNASLYGAENGRSVRDSAKDFQRQSRLPCVAASC